MKRNTLTAVLLTMIAMSQAIAAPVSLSQLMQNQDSRQLPYIRSSPPLATQNTDLASPSPRYSQTDLEEQERKNLLVNTLAIVQKQKEIERLDQEIAIQKTRIQKEQAVAVLRDFEQNNESFSETQEEKRLSTPKDGFQEQLAAASIGDDVAQFNVATAYFKGAGVKKDHKKAFEWYKKSASLGNAKAQFNLGLMLTYGDGVKMNLKTAELWYQRACDNGYSDGCEALKMLKQQTPKKRK